MQFDFLVYGAKMVGSGKKLHRGPKGREWVRVLGEGVNQPPPNQLEDSPSGVWGAAPAEIEFSVF